MKESLLTILRNKDSSSKDFRSAAHKLAHIIAGEEAIKIKQKKILVETDLSFTEGKEIAQKVCLIPILRSGIALLPAFLHLFDKAPIGMLGIRRDETTYKPNLYYDNLPPINKDSLLLILDPMIATGGTICKAAQHLISKGALESNIKVFSILSTPEGLKLIKENYKNLSVNTIATDEALNAQKYIVPGLGDFGDRYFGTF